MNDEWTNWFYPHGLRIWEVWIIFRVRKIEFLYYVYHDFGSNFFFFGVFVYTHWLLLFLFCVANFFCCCCPTGKAKKKKKTERLDNQQVERQPPPKKQPKSFTLTQRREEINTHHYLHLLFLLFLSNQPFIHLSFYIYLFIYQYLQSIY